MHSTLRSGTSGLCTSGSPRPPEFIVSTSTTRPQDFQERWRCKVSLARTRSSQDDTLPKLTNVLQETDVVSLKSAFLSFLRQTDLTSFVRVIYKLHEVGLPTAKYVGPSAMGVLAQQLEALHNQDARVCVRVLLTLSQCRFDVKNLVSPLLIMQSCAKIGDVKLMLRYTRLLPRNVRIFNDVITGLGQQGDLGAAKFVVSFLSKAGYKPDMYLYRALVDACAMCGQPAEAYSVFQEILEAGLSPNIYVCNSLLHANVMDLSLVRKIYKQMQDLGVKADPPTYHILLKAFCAAGRHQLVCHLYEEVKSCVAQNTIHLDNLTYSRFIQAFGDARMWQLAVRVKDDMLQAGVVPNAVTWNCLIGVFATCGLGGEALRMFHSMILGGCDPNTASYNMVLRAFAEGGHEEKAFQLFEEWKRDGLFSSILREDFSSADLNLDTGQQGDEVLHTAHLQQTTSSESLRNWARSAGSCKPDLVTYNTMLKACTQTPQDAELLMQEMRSAGIRPDQKSWSTLLDTYGSAGDLEGASKVFWDMKQASVPHDAVSFTSMIKACVLARDSDTAFRYFDQMKAGGIQPNAVTYNTLLRAQRKSGQLSDVQRALALYEEMREAGYAPKDRILKGLLEEWAEGALQPGNNAEKGPGLVPDEPSTSYPGLNKYTESLLQKVAAHVNTDQGGETIAIDLRGLSKAESRLAVLAVLRIFKGRHGDDNPVVQDLEIITGVGRQRRSLIQDAVLSVLRDELGLTVLFGNNQNVDFQRQDRGLQGETALANLNSSTSIVKLIGDRTARPNVAFTSDLTSSRPDPYDYDLGMQPEQSTPSSQVAHRKVVARRPLNPGRLKVSKDALNAWLRKGMSTKTERRSI